MASVFCTYNEIYVNSYVEFGLNMFGICISQLVPENIASKSVIIIFVGFG
jgi:hypothetical protein